MRTFLQSVAQDLKQRFASDFTHVALVFPNKRARLFMNETLMSMADGPLWAPHYTTISELFSSISHKEIAPVIPTIASIYNLYSELMGGEAESIDKFWGWGEILLNDFDDIDKHLVNAHALFCNASDLAEMDSVDFLSDEQEASLRQFFSSFSRENKTYIQSRFMRMWKIMPELYDRLRAETEASLSPYEGALQREVIESPELLKTIPSDMVYCFVGFNMLSETEKKLMKYLMSRGQALFYWDLDEFYYANPEAEAGDFIRQNMRIFPSALTQGDREKQRELFDNLRHKEQFTYVSTSTDSIASRYIPSWLSRNLTKKESETAIILCDEQQLMPVLHSIPDEGTPQEVNITMGYSLRNTPIHSLIMSLIDLQTDGWDKRRKRHKLAFVNNVKRHAYAHFIEEEMWLQRVDADDAAALLGWLDGIVMSLVKEDMDVLYTESIFLMHKTLRQFIGIIEDPLHPLSLKGITFRRLLKRALSSCSIPFHGEPAQGLQIMGLLETRCLDFRNILMLNVGEGFVPKATADNSLIPNTLRAGFGLTTARHRTAVFAYYFYRIIQRAESVTFVYNENSAGVVRHEMSRFLRQLQAETDIPIKAIKLEAGQSVKLQQLDEVKRTPETTEILHRQYNRLKNPEARSLSPSSINRYLKCQMWFYLSNIAHIPANEEKEDVVDAPTMGTIFHNVAEKVYREISRHSKDGRQVTRQALSTYLADDARLLQGMIDEEFAEVAGVREFRGENILIRNVVEKYLIALFRYDLKLTPFRMEAMEKDFSFDIETAVDGLDIRISTGGRVDRIDWITGGLEKCAADCKDVQVMRIVDYKTGAHQESPGSLDNLFTQDKHAGYYLQAFLYAVAVHRSLGIQGPVKPVLFYPGHSLKTGYDPTLSFGTETKPEPVLNISDYEEDFVNRLTELVKGIFACEGTFARTSEPKTCEWCEYRNICRI